jgi:hypothetical protein
VQAKSEQMEKSVRVSEREYSKKMADLNRGFEVGSSFLFFFCMVFACLSLFLIGVVVRRLWGCRLR